MNRDFKGIWIPKEVWLNKNLTVMEKLFLVEIDSLDNKEGCFASNKHFATHFGISKGRCTQILKQLEEKNIISIAVERNGKIIVKRVVRILNTLVRKLNNPSEKTKQPYLENDEESNTSINNTKESSKNALNFIKNNTPEQLEIFEMQNKNSIKDYSKFCLDFNDTVDMEQLEYKTVILMARLRKYARNWQQNQNKFNKQPDAQLKPVYRKTVTA